MGKEYIFGLIIGAMKVNGKTIKCMVKVFSLGLMVECMRETTMMTKSKAEVFSLGQMAGDMMVNGTMESSMERVSIIHQREKSREESGKKVKESDGSLLTNESL